MSIPLTVNGAVFDYPQDFDEEWGVNATGWAQAVTNGMLQMAGGSFPLQADVNFGSNFGLLAKYFETRSANPSTAGTIRLSSADAGVGFRNNANTGNLVLTTNSSDQLLYNGHPIASTSGGAVTSIIGTTNQIIASSATGDVTLSTPQDIATISSPTFASLTLTSPLTVSNGGTGDSSFTAYAVITGGTTSTAPLQTIASIGSVGQVLTSNGPGVLPSFANTTGSGTVNTGTAGNISYYATTSTIISDAGIARTNIFLADGSIAATGNINANSHKVTNLTNGSSAQDAVAFDQLTTGAAITTGGIASNTLTGSTANSGGSAGNVAQGTISTPDFRANAVTQEVSVNGGNNTSGVNTNIDTVSITTVGGPVLLCYTLNLSGAGSGAFSAQAGIWKDAATTLVSGSLSQVSLTTVTSYTLNAYTVDTPTAGAHTYKLQWLNQGGATQANGYTLTAVELRA